jgi:superfamily II DNA helicase RecQ
VRLHFATVPIHDGDADEAARNRFLASHRVVAIERHFVADGPRSAWAVCVSWVEGPARLEPGGAGAAGSAEGRKGRIDYRDVLSADQFALYVRLRDTRKRLAERDGVPPYAVVTNEQLAEIVRRDARTLAELGAIEGIGPARVQKYGAALTEAVAVGVTSGAPGAPAEAAPDEPVD